MSIFMDTSVRRLEDAANTHVFNVSAALRTTATHTHNYYHVMTAGSYLADDSTAIFAVALHNAGLVIVKLPPIGSRGIQQQGGHSPGRDGKVREFNSGQGKVKENVFLHA